VSAFNKLYFIELKTFLLLQFASACAILIPIRRSRIASIGSPDRLDREEVVDVVCAAQERERGGTRI
jgi:hypothetical protein